MTEPRRKNIKHHTPHWKEEVCHSTAWTSLRHLQMLDICASQVRNACLQRIRDSRDKLIWDKRAGKAQQQVCHAASLLLHDVAAAVQLYLPPS